MSEEGISDISVPPENWYERNNLEHSPIGYGELGETDISGNSHERHRRQYTLNWDRYVEAREKR